MLTNLCVYHRVKLLGGIPGKEKVPYLGVITDVPHGGSECDQILKKLRVELGFSKMFYCQIKYAVYINSLGTVCKVPAKYPGAMLRKC